MPIAEGEDKVQKKIFFFPPRTVNRNLVNGTPTSFKEWICTLQEPFWAASGTESCTRKTNQQRVLFMEVSHHLSPMWDMWKSYAGICLWTLVLGLQVTEVTSSFSLILVTFYSCVLFWPLSIKLSPFYFPFV